MANNEKQAALYRHMIEKGCLKQKVYRNTYDTLQLFKNILQELTSEYRQDQFACEFDIPFEYREKSEFEIELKFAGDILILLMHTNVFEFPRDHFIHKTSYIKEDPSRSFSGMISIYNFLSDSLKYRRLNDVGYLIGRVFINRDNHFYIDGKKELRLLPNNFVDMEMTGDKAREILRSAIMYTIDFDLLTPPYDQVKEITVHEIMATLDTMTLKTGKRLGFRFQADFEDRDAE